MKLNAERIRTLREQRAWSQEHLAAVAGLSARTLQRIEAGSTASQETCLALAAALEVQVAELRGDAANAGATGTRTTGDPVSARMPAWIVMSLLLIVLVVWFGYTIGKDLAFRDNGAYTGCARDGVACSGHRHGGHA